MAKDDSFEMPDMRAFAEKSVEQAKKAFDNFAAAAQQAVNTAQTQALSAQEGVRDIGELAIRNTEKNIAASFAFAQRLIQAKDAREIADLHAEYIKSQMQALAEQAQEFGRRAMKIGSSSSGNH
jgi:phasin